MSSSDPAVSLNGLTKIYKGVRAVDSLTVDIRAGRVTGLLGRNGAGKTTTLRMLLGLATPTAGTATILGKPYAELPDAAHRIGVSMDGMGGVTGATVRGELRIWCTVLGLPAGRADQVMEYTGLDYAADRPVKGCSTGMRQRLALATALLADPEILILDEPANGLDPDGIRWLRATLRTLALGGRTVIVSSHQLAELEQTVDDVVIMQHSLRYAGTLDDLTGDGAVRLEDRFFELVDPAATAVPPADTAATATAGIRTPERNYSRA
ncbi:MULTISPECIES: ABC transporter ATP-binding protein [unclassified Streptomyces]|uniref:ABC transporter ATP-binding protein n=1 Tax=unclassified Streptomyces TaxID=2593676 RepID=UPI00202DC0E7|nr:MULTISPECIES: ATP-binding cassette domain-containing protein [unclassified Streptomyces]MCM1971912.1 ATP-binding cassette domain-containing protein [Streptomyces sp. G1]MCX5130349.1 ATP-binding cassette domain-containing protein [Streptomyces sp. NBC_00347]MCX5301730.1 ATP-binding cassette domain-containing protein [Streptomyces sp. NBC_00193]